MADITGKPNIAVSKLSAPVRQSNSRTMKATWSIPSALVKSSSSRRATGIEIDWSLGIPGTDPKKVTTSGNERLNNNSINLNNLKIGSTTYTRNSFYPVHKTRTLSYVTVTVIPKNKKGRGKSAKATRNFLKPRTPSIDTIGFNPETGAVSTTITTNEGSDYYERYDTKYKVTVENTRTGRKWNSTDSSSTSTSFNASYNATDYQQLSYNEYIKVTFSAFARGYAGDSSTASKSFYISYPAQATIEGIDVSAKDMTGKCTLRIKTNSTAQHPVDRVKLEYLADCDYKTEGEIPGGANWTTSDIIDDGNCNALAIPVAELLPSAGKYTWVRVKSYHADEAVLYRYSKPMRVDQLETPARTAADDDITILSAVAGINGESAVVTLGWNADGEDDSTGTELSWSDEEDTWKSTEAPSIFNFEWSDGPVTVGSVTYQDSATVIIKGLQEGGKYYIKARRYLEGETTSYSPYSNAATVITSQRPESIVASCNRYVPSGEALTVRWTFSGYSIQKDWQIVQNTWYELTEDTEVVEGRTYYEKNGDVYTEVTPQSGDDPAQEGWYVQAGGTVLASGSNSLGSTQLSADRLKEFAVDNSITFTVQVSTGSSFVISEEHTVTIVDAPTLSISVPATLTRQDPEHPFTFSANVSTPCDLTVIVTSQGATSQFPNGVMAQADGDTIHSGVYSPVWNNNAADVALPAGLDFWDLCQYTIEVTATDRTSGLKSETIKQDFDVEWTRQAPDPSEAVTLTVIDTVDAEGDHRQAVQIDLTPPQDSEQTDVYDIYRMDVENPALIGEGFPLTHTTVDEYAPFGSDLTLYYRVALRTIDGDVEFADIEYTAQCDNLRFDWAGGFLELPYGIAYGDSYTKDVEFRKHMNGETSGYWSNNVERKSSLASDVIKIVQPRDIEKTRLLGRYNGPVFVRKPDGSAFEADVQVNDLSKKNDAVVHVAFDGTEIALTNEFALPIPFELEEEEE